MEGYRAALTVPPTKWEMPVSMTVSMEWVFGMPMVTGNVCVTLATVVQHVTCYVTARVPALMEHVTVDLMAIGEVCVIPTVAQVMM